MQQFRELLPTLEPLAQKVYDLLRNAIQQQGIYVTAMEYRVKTEKSLAGKLERKGAKYGSITDITDLVGVRIITFYTDEVDKVAAIAKGLFSVDWQESVDKRKLHQLNSFGYNSLHYICRLREGSIRFELQMRTALQHVWSTIEHDIGYKGFVTLPPAYKRQFSRLAGMLELVDDEFSRLRTTINDYNRKIQSLVSTGNLEEVPLRADTFRSYLDMHPFQALNQRIAASNQAEICPFPLLPFMRVFQRLGLETIGDVERLIRDNEDDAYQLAVSQLAMTDLDIILEALGPMNLSFVYVLKQGRGVAGLKLIYDLLNGFRDDNEIMARMTMEQASSLPFMAK